MHPRSFRYSFFIVFLMLIACEKNTSDDGLLSAKLHYTPSCATINGYIVLDGNDETYVFQHQIAERFRKEEIKVSLSFEKSGNGLLTAECVQAPIIRILELRER